jgi:hypothetical protein
MSTQPISPAGRAELDAARLLLARMGISPADLLDAAPARPPVPTFAEYLPVVCAAVSDGTRRVYGSYWNRILDQWGGRRLDQPTPSEVERLAEHVRSHTVARRNARGGRSAAEHLIAALRCLYTHAVADGLLSEADNPARRVAKPRRLPSTRRAVADTRLAEINRVAASTGNDPVLDSLLLRLHTETALRVPKSSSTLFMATLITTTRSSRGRPPHASDRRAMMPGCAASTGLSRHDQRARATATATHERPRERCGDPGPPTPDQRPGTPTARREDPVRPCRPGVSRRTTAPAAPRRASPHPAVGASRDRAAGTAT